MSATTSDGSKQRRHLASASAMPVAHERGNLAAGRLRTHGHSPSWRSGSAVAEDFVIALVAQQPAASPAVSHGSRRPRRSARTPTDGRHPPVVDVFGPALVST